MSKNMFMQFITLTILFSDHTALSMDSKKLDNNDSRLTGYSVWQDNPLQQGCSLKEKPTIHQLLNRLIENVEFLQDHEQDYIDLFHDYITEANLCSINKNIMSCSHILSLLNKLSKDEGSIHLVLKEMLILRTSLIKSRRSNTEKYENAKGDLLYGPTDPAIYDFLTPEQIVLAQKATDHYQMFNRVIIGLLSCLDSHTLPPNIKECLRASPTLCSIIISGTKNLGHPDETFDLSGRGMKDWEYYQTHIYASEQISITVFSTCYREDKIITVTPYVRKIYQPGWQHPYAHNDLPYPDFLKPISTLAANKIRKELLSTSHTRPTSIDILNIEGPQQDADRTTPYIHSTGIQKKIKKNKTKKNKKAILVSSTPAPVGDSIPKLDLRTVNSIAGVDDLPQASFYAIAPEMTGNTINQVPILSLSDSPQNDELKMSNIHPGVPQPTVVSLADWQDLPTNSEKEAVATVFKESTSSQVDQVMSLITPSADYLPPRGMRLFHSNQPITLQTPHADVKGKQLKTLRNIFAKAYSPVKYGKVAALWRHINGFNSIDESGGTSHKELLDKDGNVVMGIFAHNDNTRYGSRTIKYIRDAFTRIGYGSSYFD